MTPKKIRNILAAIFLSGVGVGTGVVLFPDAPAINASPNLKAPCIGGVCFACVHPTVAECAKFMLNGGEPTDAFDPVGADPYAGAAGKLARAIRQTVARDAALGFHAQWRNVSTGTCRVTVFLSRDQRRAWRQTVDVLGLGSEVVDCRRAQLPGGKRSVVLAGTDPDVVEYEDTDDAGPEPLDGGP